MDIQLCEFDGTKFDDAADHPNLIAFTSSFNQISGFAAHEIVHASNPKREAVKVLDAAEQALKNGNTAAAFALYTALTDVSVSRLKAPVFDKFSNDQKKRLAKLETTLSLSDNFLELRKTIDRGVAEQKAMTPLLAIYTKDLTGIGEIPSQSSEEGHVGEVNVARNWSIARIKNQVHTMQGV